MMSVNAKTVGAETSHRVHVLANRVHRGRVRDLTDAELDDLLTNTSACGVALSIWDAATEEQERRRYAR